MLHERRQVGGEAQGHGCAQDEASSRDHGSGGKRREQRQPARIRRGPHPSMPCHAQYPRSRRPVHRARWRRQSRPAPRASRTTAAEAQPGPQEEQQRRPEEQQAPVDADQQAPRPVQPWVREPIVRIAAKQLAEAQDFERSPHGERSGRPGRCPQQAAATRGRRVRMTSGRSRAGTASTRLLLARTANPAAKPAANARPRLTDWSRTADMAKSSAQRQSGRLDRFAELEECVRAERRSHRRQQHGRNDLAAVAPQTSRDQPCRRRGYADGQPRDDQEEGLSAARPPVTLHVRRQPCRRHLEQTHRETVS